MFQTFLDMSRTIVFVLIVIPMMMGLVFSLLGVGVVQCSQLLERRRARSLRVIEPRPSVESAPVVRARAMAGADT